MAKTTEAKSSKSKQEASKKAHKLEKKIAENTPYKSVQEERAEVNSAIQAEDPTVNGRAVPAEIVENLKDKAKHKSEHHKHTSKKKLSPAKVAAGAVITLLTLLAVGSLGFIVWSANNPQYAYYQLYQAAKAKDYDRFAEHVDLNTLASNVATEQAFYLQGREVDPDLVKFQLKGQIEYTLSRMVKEGSMVEVLPAKPENLWDAYTNNKFTTTRQNKEYQVRLENSSKKDELEGISGYKTAVMEVKNGRWSIVKLQDNATVEAERQKMQQTPQE
jgi:hypothetical protein